MRGRMLMVTGMLVLCLGVVVVGEQWVAAGVGGGGECVDAAQQCDEPIRAPCFVSPVGGPGLGPCPGECCGCHYNSSTGGCSCSSAPACGKPPFGP